jgi:hypothetical protein
MLQTAAVEYRTRQLSYNPVKVAATQPVAAQPHTISKEFASESEYLVFWAEKNIQAGRFTVARRFLERAIAVAKTDSAKTDAVAHLATFDQDSGKVNQTIQAAMNKAIPYHWSTPSAIGLADDVALADEPPLFGRFVDAMVEEREGQLSQALESYAGVVHATGLTTLGLEGIKRIITARKLIEHDTAFLLTLHWELRRKSSEMS